MLKIVLFCYFAYFANALPNWNDLKVTWGLNPFGSNIFVSVPRFEIDAIGLGWQLDKDCSKINGKRYFLNNDRAVMLIFGVNRYISGISTVVPKNLPFNFPSAQIKPILVDEGDFYTLNAYFVDPSQVCTNKDEPASVGGDRLVVKGDGMEISVPLNEKDVSKQGFWTKGYCFYTMGQHYWANVKGVPLSVDMNPDEFFPMFLLYNKGQLNGFGWALNADLNSIRYEHPDSSVVSQFMNPVPKFFSDPTKSGKLSTMHIYLDDSPRFNFC
jgi:hypothetical protein